MIAKYLWEAGSIVIAFMGAFHIYGTLKARGMDPTNSQLIEDMKSNSPKLISKLNMWDSWIGFNVTHGIGAVFVGSASFYMASKYFDVLSADAFLQLLTILSVGGYALASKRYWFKVVTISLSVALSLFVIAAVLMSVL